MFGPEYYGDPLKNTQFSYQKQGIDAYYRRFDAYVHLKRGIEKGFRQEALPFLWTTFRGEVMHQFGLWTKLCVRKRTNRYSKQAQFSGEVMRQEWRGYGNSNKMAGYFALGDTFAHFRPFSQSSTFLFLTLLFTFSWHFLVILAKATKPQGLPQRTENVVHL